MKLWDYINVAKLERHIEDGLVETHFHNDFPLVIYTYGRKAVYENIWDDVTEKCRGLIVNLNTTKIVARPFEKFFNINTLDRPETHLDNLPSSTPIVMEKLDGSLGTLYHYDGKAYIASKGSFHSDHANWATNWYNTHVPWNAKWPEGYTPVFEMVCESVQHHVVHYGKENLVLLALIEVATGEELPQDQLETIARGNGFISNPPNGLELPRLYNFSFSMFTEDRPNSEGYVLSWPRPGKTPLRVKVKHQEFLRQQKMVHSASPKAVLEALAAGNEEWLQELTNSPNEYLSTFVRQWRQKLVGEYGYIFAQATHLVKNGLLRYTTRKEYADFFNQPENKQYAAVCFALLDQRDHKRIIWRMLEPSVAGQKPLLEDEE